MENSSFSNNSAAISTAFLREVPTYETALQTIFLILVFVVAILGNGFVGFCVFTQKNLQLPTNYFIVSLAAADFLFALLALPFRIYDVLARYVWELSLAACRFWVWLDLLFCSASIANLAAISVDRYLKISSPLTYNLKMTRTRVGLTLGILWGYSALVATLTLVEWSADPRNHARGTIVDENQICHSDDKIFLTIVSALGFFAPLAIMLLMYLFVFKVAVIQAKRVARQTNSLKGVPKKRRRTKTAIALLEVKATKTLIILLSVFCICWCPYFIISLISLYKVELFSRLPLWFLLFLKIVFVNFLPNLNAALNPIVYTTSNHQFRTVVRRMLRRQRQRARGLASSVYSDGWYSMSESRIVRRSGSSAPRSRAVSSRIASSEVEKMNSDTGISVQGNIN